MDNEVKGKREARFAGGRRLDELSGFGTRSKRQADLIFGRRVVVG